MHFRALIVLALAVVHSPLTAADEWTTINPSANWGWWDGWGTSLAWWAKAFGDRDDLADIFFTHDWHPINGQWLPGLGLNIVRYNAGASSWNSVDGQSMVVTTDMKGGSRQMEGYWLDWYNSDPSSGSWNWWVDSNQRNMLWKARDRGANFFELFSNSPMWWMCYNHNPEGADGSGDNLQSWNYDQHAVYLATIAKFASDNWGFSFQSVEPFNEPTGWWWNPSSEQEGCHYDTYTQAQVIGNLRDELNNRGLGSTIISASDENTYDQAIQTWNDFISFSPAGGAASIVGRINVHGYQGSGGRRDTLSSIASDWGKALWNSEYGDSDGGGRSLVSNLILDFRWLHQTAWVYWQVLDGDGWGLIQANNADRWIGPVNQKYFLLAQFTRHIRQGMQILDGGSDHTVAAYDWTNQKLIIVAVNWGDGRWINFDLSRFKQGGVDGNLVQRWSTQIDSGEQYGDHSDTYMSGTRFWSWFNNGQVQTFEVPNVLI